MAGGHQMLIGGGSGVITLTSHTINSFTVDPVPSVAYFTLRSDGVAEYYASPSGTGTISGQWVLPADMAPFYECRATVTSGSLDSGTTGSWLALTSNRSWSITQSGFGSRSCIFTLDVGYAGSSSPVVTVTITLNATVDV